MKGKDVRHASRALKVPPKGEKKMILAETWASLVAQKVKCLPAMQETWVRFLGHKDPLEKEMATHSSTLAWKIPWTKELVGYSSWDSRVRHD